MLLKNLCVYELEGHTPSKMIHVQTFDARRSYGIFWGLIKNLVSSIYDTKQLLSFIICSDFQFFSSRADVNGVTITCAQNFFICIFMNRN